MFFFRERMIEVTLGDFSLTDEKRDVTLLSSSGCYKLLAFWFYFFNENNWNKHLMVCYERQDHFELFSDNFKMIQNQSFKKY